VRSTLRVFGAEWYRLIHGRSVWVSSAVLVVVSFLRVLATWVAERSAYASAVQRAVLDGRDVPPVPAPSNAYGPLVDGWSTGLTVGAMLLLIAASRSVAGDLESGLLRMASSRSASRSALALGRCLLGIPLCVGVMFATAAGAGIAAWMLFAFGPVVEDGYELMSEPELRAQLLMAVATTTPSLIATWAFGVLVSSASRSAAVAVGATLVLYLGFDLFKEVLGVHRYWVFAAFNPSFVDNSYIKEVAGMARGFSDAGFTEGLLNQNLILPWPEAVALMALTGLVLSRRSL